MPNFIARESDTPAKPAPQEPLPHISDGTSINQYYHRSRTDTVRDVCRPGHFDFMRDTFRSGAKMGVVHMVKCMLGEVVDGLTEVDLHLVEAPSPYSGPVLMAKGAARKYTPVKHDAEAADEETESTAAKVKVA